MGVRLPEMDPREMVPVGQVELGHVHVRWCAGRFFGCFGWLRRLISERGEVPNSIAVAQQRDFRMVNDDLGDVELLAENERYQFDAYLERFRLDKRFAAEFGIVGNGELVGAHAAGEDAEA
jgi:hypothetical protein